MLNWIEIWGVRREIQKSVSRLCNGLLHATPLMETSIIKNNNTLWWKFWYEIFLYPLCKHDRINCGREKAHCQQVSSPKSPYGVGSSFGSPIVRAITSFSFSGVSICPWHIMGKARFIQVNYRSIRLAITSKNSAKGKASFGIRFWVREGFFYRSHLISSKLSISQTS